MASPMLHPARTSANQCTPSKSRLNPIRMGKQAVINRIVILPLLIFSMERISNAPRIYTTVERKACPLGKAGLTA